MATPGNTPLPIALYWSLRYTFEPTAAAAGITLTSTAAATDLVPYLVVASNRILLGAPQLAFA